MPNTVTQSNYYDFVGIGNPEKIVSDVDSDGTYDEDDGDCFEDRNANGTFDLDAGRTGRGGANDVVFYEASLSMKALTPLRSFVGGDDTYHRHAGEVDTVDVEVAPPVWLRLRRLGDKVGAEISDDETTWTTVWSGALLPGAVLAGPAAAGGDRRSEGQVTVAWVGAASVEVGTLGSPSPGTFALDPTYPNPTRGRATAPLAAGREGGYEIRVLDRLGRVVLGPIPYQVRFPSRVDVPLDVGRLSAGTYFLHAVHLESGEGRVQPLTVIR